MTVTAPGAGRAYVLVHGGWHGAWAFGKVAPLLALEGHHVLAEDLPGHGLRAQFPRSYRHRPLDMGKFAAEPSPVSGLTLADYADQVEVAVRLLAERMPGHQVILVGHSMAGLVLHRVGEAIPQLISRLVYLSAWMTAGGRSFWRYAAAPEMAATKINSIVIGDPTSTGALRVDFRSADPAYRALVKSALAADVDDDDWEAAANLLTPDAPAAPTAEPVALTASRWGAIPRTYISCTADQALPLAAQRRFIAEADELTPDNPTDVREVAASHSPFISRPQELASILLEL